MVAAQESHLLAAFRMGFHDNKCQYILIGNHKFLFG